VESRSGRRPEMAVVRDCG